MIKVFKNVIFKKMMHHTLYIHDVHTTSLDIQWNDGVTVMCKTSMIMYDHNMHDVWSYILIMHDHYHWSLYKNY